MNWSDWEMIWRRQKPPLGADADLAFLQQTFEAKRRQLARGLLARDLAEAFAGGLVSVAMILIWWHQGKAGWPIAIALVLVLGVTGFFIRERIRAHRQRLGADAPLRAKLEAEIAELRHQRRLLLSLWTWYLAPCAGAIVIVVATISYHRPIWDRNPIFLGGYGLFCALLFWGVWRLNRQAVRKQLDPRLEELEKMHRDLLASE